MGTVAIQGEHVGKKFCKSLKKSMLYGAQDIAQSSIGIFPNSNRLRSGEFWALQDINFDIHPGDTFGIIGPNGSGKTTLLKMLNGIFMPDQGKITVEGRVGALIQIGAGFHPMLSGYENIYINGAILGMGRREIIEKFDSIIDFADIGDFLETPVKYYSSGMYVRLGFAIAVHSCPDILLIDEILAVGDKEFQIKCYQKIHEIKKRGTTILLVSHNEYIIREHTQHCLYLDHGKQRFLGPSEEAISLYIKDVFEYKAQRLKPSQPLQKTAAKKASIEYLKFLREDGTPLEYLETGAPLTIEVKLDIRQRINQPIIGVNFYDEDDLVYSVNSYYEQLNLFEFNSGTKTVKVRIPECHLPINNYMCSVIIAEESVSNLIDWHDFQYKLIIGRAQNSRGKLKLTTQWEFH